MKKVLLIVVDAIASHIFIPALENGQLPNLKALAEAGSLHPACISVFPSITPAATASIVTGRYPNQHNILGVHWYDLDNNEVVYYGDDFWVILSQGLAKFFEGLLVKLNHDRLQAPTLFQMVERAGYRAACLNYLIFRGDIKHRANIPLLLSMLPGVPFARELLGPSIFHFGDLVDIQDETTGEPFGPAGGLFRRFGFKDDNTADRLVRLAEKRALPDFTLAYFPDNDFRSHEVGPETAVTTLENLDNRLSELFEAYGGLERLLDEFCVMLTGDHSQSDILADEKVAGIRLNEVLDDFAIAPAGEPWGSDHELVIGINMRTAQIYFKDPAPARVKQAIEQLLADSRIDQVLCRAEILEPGQKGYCVITEDRGRLNFWPGSEGDQTAGDVHGQAWSWTGELSPVGGTVSDNEGLTFADYPNAFERIARALDYGNGCDLWVTARLGSEFRLPVTRIHPAGGSHGSLHAFDSTSPLLVAGLPPNIQMPTHPRIVDVTPLCLTILGLEQ